MTPIIALIQELADLGGPVVLLLVGISILAATVVLSKIWQMSRARVGSHRALRKALELWDLGETDAAVQTVSKSKSYLREIFVAAQQSGANFERLRAEAETQFAKLERGFRFLDMVAQLSPLLGLFGTVLGMISAFQALQDAGSNVDPSILAGGIWVALMTTAVGLAVAMPTSFVLSWLEGRMDAERIFAERAIQTILKPDHAA